MSQKRAAKPGEPPSTRDRLIHASARLFQRQGYHGTGLTELLDKSATPKGSFYYHFPGGKEALADAAVRAASDGIVVLIDQAFAPAQSFAEGATRMSTMVADWFEASNFGEGCPITSVLLETVPASPQLTEACRASFQHWIDVVFGHAVRLGEDEGDASILATGLVLAIEGAWIVARAQRSRHPFDVAATLVARCAAAPAINDK